MGEKTLKLINELSKVLYEDKTLLLQGGVGVGKTYLAKKIAENLKSHQFVDFPSKRQRKTPQLSDVCREIVSIHPSYSYGDFIYGIVAEARSDYLTFEYKDKIFMELLNSALESWNNKENRKYVLILDDINRGFITDILGEAIMLMETHGTNKYSITLKSGRALVIPPNFYVIATLNNLIETPFAMDFALQRRFYKYTIESDFEYIVDSESEHDKGSLAPETLYKKVKKIVLDNLNYSYKENLLERNKYIVGHGFFYGADYLSKIKWQVLPLLRQYCKDNILENEAEIFITNLEDELNINFTTDIRHINNYRIHGAKNGVTAIEFYENGTSHKPIVNIIGRIKEQNLLSDTDIERYIIFNENVLFREETLNLITYSATLYASTLSKDNLYLKERPLYMKRSKEDKLLINNVPFFVAGEMQATEFTKWEDTFLQDGFVNKRNSSAPNIVLFLIIKNYYKTFLMKCTSYLQDYAEKEEVQLLQQFAKLEFVNFVESYKKIIYKIDSNDEKKKANKKVRKLISELTLLWTNLNDTIIDKDGNTIVVKGVYKMNCENKYQEYLETMESLKINQMILQGPPGTSKTYSTREFLKYVGGGLDNNFLNELQIKDYDSDQYCDFIKNDSGKTPSIAWDIVQFHPSYGYEDFIRGIEVTTTKKSNIKYDTVNKVLGKIADLAYKAKEKHENKEVTSITKFFLIVDEINRANLATVFGELIYGLEYRGEGVATPYTVDNSNKLLLPDNLYIIGTMNTADKSIGGIDYAIRRRFLFFSLLPDKDVILNNDIDKSQEGTEDSEELLNQRELNMKAYNLFFNISRLFDEYLNPEYYKGDVQIGHTYFLVNEDDQLFKRFKYQIIPILREYVKDGMFQINVSNSEKSGWEGFLNCITGSININDEEKIVVSIFVELTKADLKEKTKEIKEA
ncbi:AAA family ATPase [Bacillus sp. FJAT-45350]|uniref:AAA family ATPase n=1 Tax=Bacillus sp. FJAT-45350 TaxID=2011014 RepID=UPI000BB70A02|nr:AAA family ATPase [Bacillus sp. FJAT-45350]